MTTIRPNPFAQGQVAQGRPNPNGGSGHDPAKTAAARAFFEAALGQSQPTAATSAAAPTTEAQAQTQAPVVRAAPAASGDQPTRILRPGSLIDIRV